MIWNTLTTIDTFDQLLAEKQLFAVFKHSTRCSVSSMIKSRLEYSWDFSTEQIPVYFLDLIKHRDVSDYISQVSHVRHESPQLIIFKNGKQIHHASHHMIMVDSVKEVLV
jgi:bacillithiol system protein YtxJ